MGAGGVTETGNGRQGVAGRRARKGRKATKKRERETRNARACTGPVSAPVLSAVLIPAIFN